tara:strand:- start:196 stop:387 length:192 start_codon:yes stop_codon:yes gene_type:complete
MEYKMNKDKIKLIELILSNLNNKNQVLSLDHLEEIFKISSNDKLTFQALVYCGKYMKLINNGV